MATVIAGLGLLGAVLLIVAEFTTLYSVNVAGRYVQSVQVESAGAHNAFAMLPIAALGALLALAFARAGSRPALAALVVIGLAALLIAVVGDLPDAHVRGFTARYQLASSSPGLGFYLETLGAVLLLAAGVLGLVASAGAGSASARPGLGGGGTRGSRLRGERSRAPRTG